jgi:hypothetical protein
MTDEAMSPLGGRRNKAAVSKVLHCLMAIAQGVRCLRQMPKPFRAGKSAAPTGKWERSSREPVDAARD